MSRLYRCVLYAHAQESSTAITAANLNGPIRAADPTSGGRAVGVILHILGLGIRQLIPRMNVLHLQFVFEPQIVDRGRALRALAPRQPPALVFKWMNSISRESFVHVVFLGVTREAN